MKRTDLLLTDVQRLEIEEIENDIGRKLSAKEIVNRFGQPSRNESKVRDELQIKQIERQIGRNLTENEKNGETNYIQLSGGKYLKVKVNTHACPDDFYDRRLIYRKPTMGGRNPAVYMDEQYHGYAPDEDDGHTFFAAASQKHVFNSESESNEEE